MTEKLIPGMVAYRAGLLDHELDAAVEAGMEAGRIDRLPEYDDQIAEAIGTGVRAALDVVAALPHVNFRAAVSSATPDDPEAPEPSKFAEMPRERWHDANYRDGWDEAMAAVQEQINAGRLIPAGSVPDTGHPRLAEFRSLVEYAEQRDGVSVILPAAAARSLLDELAASASPSGDTPTSPEESR